MAIALSSGFSISSNSPIDDRIRFKTLAEMINLSPVRVYDGLICYNDETQQLYCYSKDFSLDPVTQHWKKIEITNYTFIADWNDKDNLPPKTGRKDKDYYVATVLVQDASVPNEKWLPGDWIVFNEEEDTWYKIAQNVFVLKPYDGTGYSYVEGNFCTYEGFLWRANSSFESTIQFDDTKWDCISKDIVTWKENTDYDVYNYVQHGKKIYHALDKHTSGSDFDLDLKNEHWELVGGSSLENWEDNKNYKENDVIISPDYRIYQCETEHTSTSDFYDDISNWNLLSKESVSNASDYDKNVVYPIHSFCFHNGGLFISTEVIDNPEEWTPAHWTAVKLAPYLYDRITTVVYDIADKFNKDASYNKSDYVIYEDILYKAKENVSPADFTASQWEQVVAMDEIKIEYVADEYNKTYTYSKGDLALNEKKLYKCIVESTTGEFVEADWQEIKLSNYTKSRIDTVVDNFTTEWDKNTEYLKEAIVIKDDILYKALVDIPSGNDWDSTQWTVTDINTEIRLILTRLAPEYEEIKTYDTGSYCRYQGYIYRCLEDNITGAWDETKWESICITDELYNYLNNLTTPYDETSHYAIGDFCYYKHRLWKCKLATTDPAGTFDLACWDEIKLLDEVAEQDMSFLAAEFSKDLDYKAGDRVIHDEKFYKAKEDITSGAEFDDTQWYNVTVAHEIQPVIITKDEVETFDPTTCEPGLFYLVDDLEVDIDPDKVTIDDTTAVDNKVWSSKKTEDEIAKVADEIVEIDDTAPKPDYVFSSDKVDVDYQTRIDNQLDTDDKHIVQAINEVKEIADGAVRFDEEQTLTYDQKEQARNNISAARGGDRNIPTDLTKLVDLKTYTQASPYKTTSDGYFRVRGPASGKCSVGIDAYTMMSAGDGDYVSTFVPQGAKLYVVSGTPQIAQFMPCEISND